MSRVFAQTTRKCSECGETETLTDPKDVRTALMLAQDGIPYVCAKCELAAQNEEALRPDVLERAKAMREVAARLRQFGVPAAADVAERVGQDIAQVTMAEPTPAPPTIEGEAIMAKYECDICHKEFTGPRGSQSLGAHRFRTHGIRKNGPVVTRKIAGRKRRTNAEVHQDPLMSPTIHYTGRKPKQLVEHRIRVLGKELTHEEFLDLTNQLNELREQMRRPTSRLRAPSDSGESTASSASSDG
jgi:hypothetical protein